MDKTPKRKAIQWGYKGIGCFFTVLTAALVILISLSYWLMGDWLGWIKIYRTFYIVETHYADTIDKKTLLDGAVKGIVSTLGDKHSLYMAGDEFKEFKDLLAQDKSKDKNLFWKQLTYIYLAICWKSPYN